MHNAYVEALAAAGYAPSSEKARKAEARGARAGHDPKPDLVAVRKSQGDLPPALREMRVGDDPPADRADHHAQEAARNRDGRRDGPRQGIHPRRRKRSSGRSCRGARRDLQAGGPDHERATVLHPHRSARAGGLPERTGYVGAEVRDILTPTRRRIGAGGARLLPHLAASKSPVAHRAPLGVEGRE